MTAMEACDFFADLTYVLIIILGIPMGFAILARLVGGKRRSVADYDDEEWMWRIK